MPRTARDFSPLDPGERKNLSFDFGPQGQKDRPLAVGEMITAVVVQITLLSGVDPAPSSRLLGSPVIQPGGAIVTQKVGTLQPSAVYLILTKVSTNVPGDQDLIAYANLRCNPVN